MARWLVVFALFSVASGCGVSSEVSRQLGARCDSHDECDQLCLSSSRFPGGMCSLACDDSAACPSSSACVDLLEGVCLYTCDSAADCEFLGPAISLPDAGAIDAGPAADAAPLPVWQCLAVAGRPDGQVKVCIAAE